LAIRSIPAHAVKGHGELHRIIFDIPQPKPVVTIIGFGGVLQADVIMAKTGGFKCHLVNTGSGLDSRELNAAARDTSAEVLCFLNARTKDVSDNWLDDLVGYAIQQDIGAVGPKIVNGRNRIKHAGYILGIRDGIGRPYAGKRDGATGFFYYLVAARNVSAISLDCLIVSKKVFNEIGGFDSANFIDLYADIDLCLRLRERGYRNVWTPWARIVQEDRSYADDKVLLAQLKRRHQAAFDRDPYYNPNLSLDHEFTLAEPPRMEDIT
jgi:GT2 family glycosyltransferase